MDGLEVHEDYDSGFVSVQSELPAISLQSKSLPKRLYVEQISNAVGMNTKGVFLGDVEVTIEWFLDTEARFRSHLWADLDNIVKPILDAMTGANLPLIDDGQVQSMKVHWLDSPFGYQMVRIRLAATNPDEYTNRENLFFIEFEDGRCFPSFEAGQEAEAALVASYDALFATQQELRELGIVPEVVGQVRPIQRPFPRARLQSFRVKPAARLRRGSKA